MKNVTIVRLWILPIISIRSHYPKQHQHTQSRQSHQIDCRNLLCNLEWGSAVVLRSHLQKFKVNVYVICRVYLIVYTWTDKYVYMYT